MTPNAMYNKQKNNKYKLNPYNDNLKNLEISHFSDECVCSEVDTLAGCQQGGLGSPGFDLSAENGTGFVTMKAPCLLEDSVEVAVSDGLLTIKGRCQTLAGGTGTVFRCCVLPKAFSRGKPVSVVKVKGFLVVKLRQSQAKPVELIACAA